MDAKKCFAVYSTLGLILGFTLDLLYRFRIHCTFSYVVIVLFCMLIALSYNGKNLKHLILSSTVTTLILSIPLYPASSDNLLLLSSNHKITFLYSYPLFCYIGHCFHYAYHHDGSWQITYKSLFLAVWNLFPVLEIALLFNLITEGLIILLAFIFKTFGIDGFWDFYWNNLDFNIISDSILFCLGLSIAQQNLNIINNIRIIQMRIMYYLFPLLMVISFIYLVLYVANGFVQSTEYINQLFILTPLTLMGILFFNAYYQIGEELENEHRGLRIIRRCYLPILFIISLIMTYRILIDNRLDSNILINLLTMILFTAFYTASSFLTKNERFLIEKGNICSALFFMIFLFLTNLPNYPISFKVGHLQHVQASTTLPNKN